MTKLKSHWIRDPEGNCAFDQIEIYYPEEVDPIIKELEDKLKERKNSPKVLLDSDLLIMNAQLTRENDNLKSDIEKQEAKLQSDRINELEQLNRLEKYVGLTVHLTAKEYEDLQLRVIDCEHITQTVTDLTLEQFKELKRKAAAFEVVEDKFFDISFCTDSLPESTDCYWEIETNQYVYKGKSLLEAIENLRAE